MTISQISLASRYNSGADLWVLPPAQESSHALTLDWYLNFQILKIDLRRPQVISEGLKDILDQIGWEHCPPAPHFSSRLLLAAGGLMPCRWVLILPGSPNLTKWAEDIHRVWKDLLLPSLRVYLPPRVDPSTWTKEWLKLSDVEDHSLVLDPL